MVHGLPCSRIYIYIYLSFAEIKYINFSSIKSNDHLVYDNMYTLLHQNVRILTVLARLYEITIDEETNSPEPSEKTEIPLKIKEQPVASTFVVFDQ